MSKLRFIKIRGRIVPIGVTKKVGKNSLGQTDISLKARDGFNRVGEVWATRSSKKATRFVVGSSIHPKFQKKGVGSKLYNQLASEIRKQGGRFMTGQSFNPTPIGKIRGRIGKTKSFQGKGPMHNINFITDLKKRKK